MIVGIHHFHNFVIKGCDAGMAEGVRFSAHPSRLRTSGSVVFEPIRAVEHDPVTILRRTKH